MKFNAGILSGVAGIITALAALVAVFVNDASGAAQKADEKSEVAFQLLKQEIAYIAKDYANLRASHAAALETVARVSEQLAVVRAQLEMLGREASARGGSVEAAPAPRPAVRVSAPPPIQRKALPPSLEAAL